ncbi:MAG TPA: hypothetical protein VKU01_30315 [Bryobacteraceae bacterium]|nr:hypothetical protein [Bryobacteraceae bacterium]
MDKMDQELDALFRAYREATPDFEPSASFTPKLWSAIDARRTFVFRLQKMTKLALAGALGVCILVGGATVARRPNHITGSYVDVLAESHPLDTITSLEPEAELHGGGR